MYCIEWVSPSVLLLQILSANKQSRQFRLCCNWTESDNHAARRVSYRMNGISSFVAWKTLWWLAKSTVQAVTQWNRKQHSRSELVQFTSFLRREQKDAWSWEANELRAEEEVLISPAGCSRIIYVWWKFQLVENRPVKFKIKMPQMSDKKYYAFSTHLIDYIQTSFYHKKWLKNRKNLSRTHCSIARYKSVIA